MISKKKRKDPVYMEVRKVLLGMTGQKPGGHLSAQESGSFYRNGAVDGEVKIRFLGLTVRRFSYQVQGHTNKKKALQKGGEALGKLGRRVDLKADRMAEACRMKTYLFYPVVLVLSWEDEGRLRLQAYTARAFSASIAIWLAVRKFEKELPETFQREKKELTWKRGKTSVHGDGESGSPGGRRFRPGFREWWRKRKEKEDDEVWNGSEWVKK